jgi:hypothetical protein
MPKTTKKPSINAFLRAIYVVFLALLIALFYGLGIAAFYEAPKMPVYPKVLETTAAVKAGETETPAVKQARIDYEKANNDYQKNTELYQRNVSIIALVLAVATLVVSLVFAHRFLLISDGLLLGGGFTLVYSIGSGMAAGDAKYRFIIASIGLLITVVVGYLKFIKPKEL